MASFAAEQGALQEKARHSIISAGETAIIEKDGSRPNNKHNEAADVQTLYKEHEWNTMEVIARGDRLVQKINGAHFATLTDRDAEMSRKKVLTVMKYGRGSALGWGIDTPSFVNHNPR